MKPAKSIFHPEFHYQPSHATDIRKTFERVRRELEKTRSGRQPADKVVQLKKV
jgi:hypothetical protein